MDVATSPQVSVRTDPGGQWFWAESAGDGMPTPLFGELLEGTLEGGEEKESGNQSEQLIAALRQCSS